MCKRKWKGCKTQARWDVVAGICNIVSAGYRVIYMKCWKDSWNNFRLSFFLVVWRCSGGGGLSFCPRCVCVCVHVCVNTHTHSCWFKANAGVELQRASTHRMTWKSMTIQMLLWDVFTGGRASQSSSLFIVTLPCCACPAFLQWTWAPVHVIHNYCYILLLYILNSLQSKIVSKLLFF